MVHDMGAELVEQPQMRAFGNEIIIHRAKHGTKGIGVFGHPVIGAAARAVAERLAAGDLGFAFEDACIVTPRKAACRLAVQGKGLKGFCARYKSPGNKALTCLMNTKDCKRIGMPAFSNGRNLCLFQQARPGSVLFQPLFLPGCHRSKLTPFPWAWPAIFLF